MATAGEPAVKRVVTFGRTSAVAARQQTVLGGRRMGLFLQETWQQGESCRQQRAWLQRPWPHPARQALAIVRPATSAARLLQQRRSQQLAGRRAPQQLVRHQPGSQLVDQDHEHFDKSEKQYLDFEDGLERKDFGLVAAVRRLSTKLQTLRKHQRGAILQFQHWL